MTIADKLTLLANTKEALRAKLKLDKSIPFSEYPDYIDQANAPSGPKLQADFTTGTYKADGESKTFEDLFTFSRAGKAWLIEDTGLQEYAADVPRFDDGLLIEPSATNLIVQSAGKDVSTNTFNTLTRTYASALFDAPSPVFSAVPEDGFKTIRFSSVAYKEGLDYTFSYVLKTETTLGLRSSASSLGLESDIASYISTANPEQNVLVGSMRNLEIIPLGDGWQLISFTVTPVIDASGYGLQLYSSNNTVVFALDFAQVEQSSYRTTPVLSNGTPTTRPADYLLNNITGTTVTGDWDSTLTLSIVDGQLVHSGYGHIRSLIID